MGVIDLRSDTVTPPTESMRQAMAVAEVGDDVYGEDPTVKRLEALAAERMGMDAALFVASGTMANLISQMVHCQRGDEMLVGDQAHIFFYEQGGSAAIGGIHPRTLPNQADGTIMVEDIEKAVRPDDVHFPRSRLLTLENTHNRCFGFPLTADYMQAVLACAARHQLKVHVDGARIFNAAVSLECSPAELLAGVDSVSFCLSKGLAAPVGSLVCGGETFVKQARRVRKILGGGMRQAGVLAAAGIVALTEMVDRLADDHRHARRLAEDLNRLPGVSVDMDRVRTNIVYIDVVHPQMNEFQLCERLSARGVKLLPTAQNTLRAVTHYPLEENDIRAAVDVFSRILK